MKTIILLACAVFVSACSQTNPGPTNTSTIAVSTTTRVKATQTLPTTTPTPTETSIITVFTPVATNTPWVLSTGLSIEEHPLAKIPEIEPLVFYPLDTLTQAEVWDKHMDEWGKTLPPNEYYSVGWGNVWVKQGNDMLETVDGPNQPDGRMLAQVTRNGNVIFSLPIFPPGTTSSMRVLTVFGDHWVFEVAQRKPIPPNLQFEESFFVGQIFFDGQSLDDLHGYEESFGFQTINRKPFYFFKRESKIGISYDGQETALGYEGVWHYGCCSGGALNPRMAQNIIGFFAWRGDQWFYTEVGVFDHP